MFWVVLVVRVLLGLLFLASGVSYFLMTPPSAELPENATKFGGAMMASGYMNVVKVLEAVGGALVLSGRLVPLGLVLLTPVAVNIALFEIFLVGQPGPGLVFTALCFFLVWAYRSHFAGVFAVKPQIG